MWTNYKRHIKYPVINGFNCLSYSVDRYATCFLFTLLSVHTIHVKRSIFGYSQTHYFRRYSLQSTHRRHFQCIQRIIQCLFFVASVVRYWQISAIPFSVTSLEPYDCRSASEVKRKDMGHDDVIKWKHFPCYWPFVRGIHRSPVNSPRKGQWREALMFSLIYARING